jgi:hypothetical protein
LRGGETTLDECRCSRARKRSHLFHGGRGVSRRRIGAASCSQSRGQGDVAALSGIRKKMARPVAVVAPLSAADGFGGSPTMRNPSHTPRRPEPSKPRAATNAPRGLECSIPLLAGLGQGSSRPVGGVFISAGRHSPAQQETTDDTASIFPPSPHLAVGAALARARQSTVRSPRSPGDRWVFWTLAIQLVGG